MINTIVDLSEIDYTPKAPGEVLLQSIKQRGVAIPVHVKREKERYVCVDGRKRLSACAILAEKDARFAKIPVMLTNDYSKAGSSFWGNTLNHH